MKSILLLLLLAVLFVACRQTSPEKTVESAAEIEQLEKEVLALHDEVMPFMGEMHSLEKALRRRARITKDSAEYYVKAANELQIADSLMWDWMYAYKSPAKLKDSISNEQILEYLSTEKVRAGRVNSSMKTGMDRAKSLLSIQ